jgi:lipopolysaccharide heptosyltransferase I
MNPGAPAGGPVRRLLVVKMSSLGDLFHALPAVRCLKRGLGASVDWVAHDIYADLVGRFEDVDRAIAYPRSAFLRGARAMLRELRAERYDLVVDLQGLLKSAMVARLARGGRRIGPSFHREGAGLAYDEVAGRRDRNRHAVEENLDVVRHLGLPRLEPAFPVRFPRSVPDAPRPRVALLPCSRRPEKNWTVAGFAAVGRGLRERAGATLFVMGAPPDAAVCAELAAAMGGGAVNLCGRTGLVELGSLLQEMDLAVTVDSGPMHMAAAVGVPVVAVFGPTDPVRTGPYGPRHRVVRPGPDLRALPPPPVLDAALGLLDGLR